MSRISEWLQSEEAPLVASVVGLVSLVLSLPVAHWFPDVQLARFLLLAIAAILPGALFAQGYWPLAKALWRNPFGQLVVVAFHLVVWFMASAWAREVVGMALGLPPQDFDLTVNFTAALLYFPVWALVCGFLAGMLAVGHEVVALFKAFVGRPFLRDFVLLVGGVVVLLGCSFLVQTAASHRASLTPAIRLTAYFVDFEPAPAFSGVGYTRIRVLADGTIEKALFSSAGVQISPLNRAP